MSPAAERTRQLPFPAFPRGALTVQPAQASSTPVHGPHYSRNCRAKRATRNLLSNLPVWPTMGINMHLNNGFRLLEGECLKIDDMHRRNRCYAQSLPKHLHAHGDKWRLAFRPLLYRRFEITWAVKLEGAL